MAGFDDNDDNNKQDDGRDNDYEASKLQEKIGDAFVTTCLFVSSILTYLYFSYRFNNKPWRVPLYGFSCDSGVLSLRTVWS